MSFLKSVGSYTTKALNISKANPKLTALAVGVLATTVVVEKVAELRLAIALLTTATNLAIKKFVESHDFDISLLEDSNLSYYQLLTIHFFAYLNPNS